MIRLILILLVAWSMLGSVAAQQRDDGGAGEEDGNRRWFTVTTEPAFVRERGAWIGGEIILDVAFVSSDPFKRLRLNIPEIEGARVETLVRPHTLLLNMLGGRGYSHSTRLSIVPTVAGDLIIPEITISGVLQQRDGRTIEFADAFPAQRIEIYPPAPDFPGDVWVVSRAVDVTETWSADVNRVQVGDTIRRTVALTVHGVDAESLPQMLLRSGPGYRVLASETDVQTEKTENGFIAHLTQSWDVFIETDDIIHVDAVYFPYWDQISGTAEILTMPRMRIEPQLRNAAGMRDSLRDQIFQNHTDRQYTLVALFALPGAVIAVVGLVALWRAIPSRADWQLLRAARSSGNSLRFYAAVGEWARLGKRAKYPADLSAVSRLGPAAQTQMSALNNALFAKNGEAAKPTQIALALIGAARRSSVANFFSSFSKKLERALFIQ